MDPSQIDPEVLKAVFGLAEEEGRSPLIQRQYELAQQMRGEALGGDRARTPIGAIAKGLQGYMGGQQMAQAGAATQQRAAAQADARRRLFEAYMRMRGGSPDVGGMGGVPMSGQMDPSLYAGMG